MWEKVEQDYIKKVKKAVKIQRTKMIWRSEKQRLEPSDMTIV
jgi:hypothetical protein